MIQWDRLFLAQFVPLIYVHANTTFEHGLDDLLDLLSNYHQAAYVDA